MNARRLIFAALAGLLISGAGWTLPAEAQTDTAAKLRAAKVPGIYKDTLQLLVSKLTNTGSLSEKNAKIIENTAFAEGSAEERITVTYEGSEPVFHIQAGLTDEALNQMMESDKAAFTKQLVAELGNAIGQADLLLQLSEPAIAAHFDTLALRGYALAFEISAVNVTLQKQYSFADYPGVDATLACYMLEGSGRKLVSFSRENAVYLPSAEGVKACNDEAAAILQTEREAEAILSGKGLNINPSSAAEPEIADEFTPGGTREDRFIDTSEEFRRAVEELTPLEDPQDTEAFLAKLNTLTASYARALELKVVKPSRKLDFNELSPKEVAISKEWYTAPVANAVVRPEWIQYYCQVLVPKLDALWRPLALKVVEGKESYPVVADRHGLPQVVWNNPAWYRATSNIRNGDYSFFYYLVPEDPIAFAKAKPGSKVVMRHAMFCLPPAFATDPGTKGDMPEAWWYIRDKNNSYLGERAYDSPQSTSARTSRRNYGSASQKAGWSPALLLGNNLAVRVFEGGRFPIEKGKQYGGDFVSFRRSWECFPELKKEHELRVAEEAHRRAEENKPGIFSWVIHIFLGIVVIGSFASLPYMIFVLWTEHKRRLEPMPLPEGYSAAGPLTARPEIEAQLDELREHLATISDDEGNEVHYLTSKTYVDKAYKLVAHMRSLPDLTGDEIVIANEWLDMLNAQTRRVLNGSVKLPVIALLFAVINVVFAENFYWVLIPIFYWLSLRCPLYKVVQPEQGWLTGLRKMLRGVGAVGSMFAADLASDKYATIYRDSYGRLYKDADSGLYSLAIALVIYAVLIALIPLFIMIDGLCNFLRNYILPQ